MESQVYPCGCDINVRCTAVISYRIAWHDRGVGLDLLMTTLNDRLTIIKHYKKNPQIRINLLNFSSAIFF